MNGRRGVLAILLLMALVTIVTSSFVEADCFIDSFALNSSGNKMAANITGYCVNAGEIKSYRSNGVSPAPLGWGGIGASCKDYCGNVFFNATNVTLGVYGYGMYNPMNLSNANQTEWNDTSGSYILWDNVTLNITMTPTVTVYSPQNITYNSTLILVNFSANNYSLSSMWFYNGTANVTVAYDITGNANTTVNLTEGSYTFVFYANDTANHVDSKSVSFSINTSDITPPGTVTGLQNISRTPYSIEWNWTNPGDIDFNSTIIFINGNNLINLSTPTNSYNATNLTCNTAYMITVLTKDNAGNVNTTLVNNTASTLVCPDITPPGAVTNLQNISRTTTSIQWNWTNPGDPDFNASIIFINGINPANVSTPSHDYNATSLNCSTNYTITVLTKDNSGNVNGTQVNSTAATATCPDLTAPALSITSPLNITYNNLTQALTISATDNVAVSRVWYNWNGTNVTYTSSINITFNNGTNTVYAWANDTSGNLNATNLTFSIDTSLPSVTIISPQNTSYNTRTILVNISGANYIWYSWNGTNATYVNATNVTFNEGANTLQAWTNNTLGSVGYTLVSFTVDSTPPSISYVSPTPGAGTYNSSQTINVTAADTSLSAIIITVNGAVAQTCLASPCAYTISATGNYTFNATANDTVGNRNSTASTTIVLNLPMALTNNIFPYAVINGSSVIMNMTATNSQALWSSTARSNGTIDNYSMSSNINLQYNNTANTGRYNVTFLANNTLGAISTASDYFESFVGIPLNIYILNSTSAGVNSSYVGYYRSQAVAINSSVTGNYTNSLIVNTTLDMQFFAYNNRISILMPSTAVYTLSGHILGIDREYDHEGYSLVYGVSPDWNVTSATVRIYYVDMSYTTEGNLHLYKCDNYNFTGMVCLGSWSDVTGSATQDTGSHYFDLNVTSFSGFAVNEVSGGGGGGGGGGGAYSYTATTIATTTLPSICTESWRCDAWSACTQSGTQTRTCSDFNICGTALHKPAEQQTCTYSAPTTQPQQIVPQKKAPAAPPKGKNLVGGAVTTEAGKGGCCLFGLCGALLMICWYWWVLIIVIVILMILYWYYLMRQDRLNQTAIKAAKAKRQANAGEERDTREARRLREAKEARRSGESIIMPHTRPRKGAAARSPKPKKRKK